MEYYKRAWLFYVVIKVVKSKILKGSENMFEKLKTKYRKHDFDIKNPIVKSFESEGRWITFKSYKCNECGKELSLDLWQMEHLPFNMARGCKSR